MKLHVVAAGASPPAARAKLRTALRPECVIECHRCCGREVTPALIGAALVGGKVRGGTKSYLCVACLMRGERVVLA